MPSEQTLALVAVMRAIDKLVEQVTQAVRLLVIHDARLDAIEAMLVELHPAGREVVIARLAESRGRVDRLVGKK